MKISDLKSLVELYFKKCDEVDPNKSFLKWLKPNKPTYTWGEIKERIFKLSAKIKTLINEGDRCLILSENRPYWLMSDLAIMNAGGISVPIFTTYSSNDYKYILDDCKPSLIIVSNNDQFKKIKNYVNLNEQKIISFEDIEADSLLIKNILNENNYKKEINNNLERNMPACIIYTSGTSGNPKGVILSHGGILSNCEGAVELLETLTKKKDPTFLTWLPLSHSYEHTGGLHLPISMGAEIWYCESVDQVSSNLQEARPTLMIAVPRLYEVLYDRIERGLKAKGGLSEKLFRKAVALGLKKLDGERLSLTEKVMDRLLEKLVRAKVRQRLGCRLRYFCSGGAPLNPDIGRFFLAISPMVAITRPYPHFGQFSSHVQSEGVPSSCGFSQRFERSPKASRGARRWGSRS